MSNSSPVDPQSPGIHSDDHMHAVLGLLDPGRTVRAPQKSKKLAKKRKRPHSEDENRKEPDLGHGIRPTPTFNRLPDIPTAPSPISSLAPLPSDLQLSLRKSTDIDILEFSSDDQDSHLPTPTISRSHRTKPAPRTFHLFLNLPPELRNAIYRLLLTVPSKHPIELPKLSGAYGRRRAVEWAACNTAAKRQKHKTVFLEILQTSRQVHAEASGIIYGENVFKYRCDTASSRITASSTPSDRRPADWTTSPPTTAAARLSRQQRIAVLPPRHLPLLKRVKVVVMSKRMASFSQFEDVAALVRCFAHASLVLESFDLTWFGFERCYLEADGAICEALLDVKAERSFVVRILAQARMRKAMQVLLEQKCTAQKVVIQRPVHLAAGISGGAAGEGVSEEEDQA